MPTDPSGRRSRREPNALHRWAGRLEDLVAWGLGVLVAVALVAGLVTGTAAYRTALARVSVEQADRVPVVATLVTDARLVAAPEAGGVYDATVRWTVPGGTERTGQAFVPNAGHAGDTAALWADRNGGGLTRPPTTTADATGAAVVTGFLVGTAGLLVALLTGWALFTATGRMLARAWEQEWETVAREWSRRR